MFYVKSELNLGDFTYAPINHRPNVLYRTKQLAYQAALNEAIECIKSINEEYDLELLNSVNIEYLEDEVIVATHFMYQTDGENDVAGRFTIMETKEVVI